MMGANGLRQWLRHRRQAFRHRASGFTLLELLIAMLISGIIMSGLLYLIVEMLKIERRETAVDQVQRDMKRALEYISDDVSEAIYVYVPDCPEDGDSCEWDPAVKDLVDDGLLVKKPDGETAEVVLAFWRPDFIDSDDLEKLSCGNDDKECQNLLKRRAFYTLVVYQVVPNDGTGVWQGQARIVRNKLPKYTDPLALEAGYDGDGPIDVDPTDDVDVDFDTWTPEGADSDSISNDTLVDFVAAHDPDVVDDEDYKPCGGDEALIPIGVDTSSSFFTCIRPAAQRPEGEEEDEGSPDNQNLEIFLKGNWQRLDAGGIDGLNTAALSQDSLLPTLRTGVFVRGVIGYDPNE